MCFSMSNSLAAELRESCHTADENAVKQFLKDGADPNDCDKVSALRTATKPSNSSVFHHTCMQNGSRSHLITTQFTATGLV